MSSAAPVRFTEALDILAGRKRSGRTGRERSWTSWRRSARPARKTSAGAGVSTYLAKGVFLPGIDKASAAARAAGLSRPRIPRPLWQLGVDTGRAYAAVSGDFNPIHLSVLSAKALGMRRSIAHGMYLASRALADVGAVKGDAFRWDVAL